jgi:cell division septal protein FtsQ
MEVTKMAEPERHEEGEEHKVVHEERQGSLVGYAAIKYAAIVIIVVAILWFLARYVIPLAR